MNKPLAAQRFELTYKAVHLQCLDKDGAPIAGAEACGFIRREGEGLYLYTCWHVVTGRAIHAPNALAAPPKRTALAMTLQDAQAQNGAETAGSLRRLQVPLYDSSGRPLWFQDRKDEPQTAPNGANFRAPFYHNAVKLRLPPDARISGIQAVEEGCFLKDNTVMPGDKVLLAGYSPGLAQPFPMVLIRFIAAPKIPGNRRELLLDGCGVPGMSGCPIFLERDASIYLLGIYIGAILPSQSSWEGEPSAALGVCCDMSTCWKRMPLQPYFLPG